MSHAKGMCTFYRRNVCAARALTAGQAAFSCHVERRVAIRAFFDHGALDALFHHLSLVAQVAQARILAASPVLP